jgi:hypothetical protein
MTMTQSAGWYADYGQAADSWADADHAAYEQYARAREDAAHDFTAACERTVAPGTCTSCGTPSPELIPWSGERLCWECTDLQLDLLAKAVQEDAPVYVAVAR